MARKRSKVVAARKAAHTASVLLGDVRAVQTGRIGQRIGNRLIGRAISGFMRGKWL